MVPRSRDGLWRDDWAVESRLSAVSRTRFIRHVRIQCSRICVRKGDSFGKMSVTSGIEEYILVIDKMNEAALLVWCAGRDGWNCVG